MTEMYRAAGRIAVASRWLCSDCAFALLLRSKSPECIMSSLVPV